MVKIILVAHGPLAPALLETASGICCFEQNSVRAYSVSGKADLEKIGAEIKALAEDGEVLVLADTFGGSSCNMALSCTNGLGYVRVVCGLNLNMLLAVLNNISRLGLHALADKAVEDGKRAVFNATESVK